MEKAVISLRALLLCAVVASACAFHTQPLVHTGLLARTTHTGYPAAVGIRGGALFRRQSRVSIIMSTPVTVGGPEGKCSIPIPSQLRNTYFGVRHGHAVNNLESLISSAPHVGTKIHPLTDLGKEQARESSSALIAALEDAAVQRGKPFQGLRAFTSDFTRARETAEICLGNLEGAQIAGTRIGPIKADTRIELRERWFGTLDDTVVTNYNLVWPQDMKDARSDAGYDCESVELVVGRLKSLIDSLEQEFEDVAIVVFSHADTVQIFQTWMSGADVRTFSQFRFKNGEVRQLVLNNPDSLPPPQPLDL